MSVASKSRRKAGLVLKPPRPKVLLIYQPTKDQFIKSFTAQLASSLEVITLRTDHQSLAGYQHELMIRIREVQYVVAVYFGDTRPSGGCGNLNLEVGAVLGDRGDRVLHIFAAEGAGPPTDLEAFRNVNSFSAASGNETLMASAVAEQFLENIGLSPRPSRRRLKKPPFRVLLLHSPAPPTDKIGRAMEMLSTHLRKVKSPLPVQVSHLDDTTKEEFNHVGKAPIAKLKAVCNRHDFAIYISSPHVAPADNAGIWHLAFGYWLGRSDYASSAASPSHNSKNLPEYLLVTTGEPVSSNLQGAPGLQLDPDKPMPGIQEIVDRVQKYMEWFLEQGALLGRRKLGKVRQVFPGVAHWPCEALLSSGPREAQFPNDLLPNCLLALAASAHHDLHLHLLQSLDVRLREINRVCKYICHPAHSIANAKDKRDELARLAQGLFQNFDGKTGDYEEACLNACRACDPKLLRCMQQLIQEFERITQSSSSFDWKTRSGKSYEMYSYLIQDVLNLLRSIFLIRNSAHLDGARWHGIVRPREPFEPEGLTKRVRDFSEDSFKLIQV